MAYRNACPDVSVELLLSQRMPNLLEARKSARAIAYSRPRRHTSRGTPRPKRRKTSLTTNACILTNDA
jgi:hypothetical protein